MHFLSHFFFLIQPLFHFRVLPDLLPLVPVRFPMSLQPYQPFVTPLEGWKNPSDVGLPLKFLKMTCPTFLSRSAIAFMKCSPHSRRTELICGMFPSVSIYLNYTQTDVTPFPSPLPFTYDHAFLRQTRSALHRGPIQTRLPALWRIPIRQTRAKFIDNNFMLSKPQTLRLTALYVPIGICKF